MTKTNFAWLVGVLGGKDRARVIGTLASVGALASADAATVGASASQLRQALHISNTDIGLLVALTSLVGALSSVPFGVLADRTRRTNVLSASVVLWGAAMAWAATAGSFGQLLWARLGLGLVMGSAGPAVASLVGDYFPGGERGRTYSLINLGELVGAGLGFAVTGDIAALSWRAAFATLALPALLVAWLVARLPEPARGATFFASPVARSAGPGPGRPGAAASSGSPKVTDAQQLAVALKVAPAPHLAGADPATMTTAAATRYILRVKTNILLVVSGACGYYFLAGVQTFGPEFVKGQYHISQAVANLLLLVIGAGAAIGALSGGPLGDWLLRQGRLQGRVAVATVTATATPLLFVPALLTASAATALPYLVVAGAMLAAQNPPIDAARLDIMPALLWGRAEGVRTFVRTGAQALAPLLFGAVSDLLGGGRAGLQYTFLIMLAPLTASAYFLFPAIRTVGPDVAAAAAASRAVRAGHPPAPPSQTA